MVEGQGQGIELAGQLDGQAPAQGESGEGAANGEGRRDSRRSRDRYGRDRRERTGREEAGQPEASASNTELEAGAPADTAEHGERRPRYATGFVDENPALQSPARTGAESPTRVPATEQRIAPIAVQPPAPATGLPKVQPFQLPVDHLAQVAASSGLQWVNSDAEKIAAVQAAIASEPKPIRLPRERPPVMVLDEGPLVLVETRRDLRVMKLPFEQPPAAPLQ